MTVLLEGQEKSEYYSSVDGAGNIASSGRVTPGRVIHGVAGTVLIHDQNQNQYLNSINGIGAAGLPLPEAGTELTAGEIYVWNAQNVMVRQDHVRTADQPDTVPALFSVYREATDEMLWIPNEQVLVGDDRIFDSLKYATLQGHQTQEGWEPPEAPALWVLADTGEEWPAWVQPTGAHDAYHIDDQVSHVDKHWISTNDANTWEPGVYGWVEVI